MTRPTARERYLTDPQFHMLVDTLTAAIERCDYTPSELREAALLASIKYESMHVHNRYVVSPELEEALVLVHRLNREAER